jgi:KEOPS complex subunit Pcc1
VARHEAIFRFTSDHAKKIYLALQPELPDDVNPRSTTCCWTEGETTLVLKISAQDTASLRAALNMYLRLISVSDEVQDLVSGE